MFNSLHIISNTLPPNAASWMFFGNVNFLKMVCRFWVSKTPFCSCASMLKDSKLLSFHGVVMDGGGLWRISSDMFLMIAREKLGQRSSTAYHFTKVLFWNLILKQLLETKTTEREQVFSICHPSESSIQCTASHEANAKCK